MREDKEDCRKAVKIHHVRQVCFGLRVFAKRRGYKAFEAQGSKTGETVVKL